METKQHRSSISREVLIALGFFFILTAPLRAQYTADYQTNIISGVTSNWMGSYLVGSNTFADVLLIQNAGVLSNRTGYLGYEASSSNNSVVVAGLGSIWGQPLDLYDEGFYVFIGYSGPGNSLVISNGGLVQCGHMYGSYLGYNSSSSNNTMLVTGTGSVWSNGGLFVGYSGGGNSLIISNGGQVVGAGYIGNNPSSGDNNVVVTGSGSLWRIGCLGGPVSCYWPIGGYGSTNNRVVISDGGSIVTFDIILGGTSNALVVSGGSLLCYPTHLEYPHNVLVGVNDNSIVISNGGEFSSQQFYLESTNNIVLVTGPGSVWSNGFLGVLPDTLSIDVINPGHSRPFHCRMVIDDYGQVVNRSARVGGDGSANNSVRVLNGASWQNTTLFVGSQGSSNSVVVAGGTVFATNVVIGSSTTNCDNWMQLDSGRVIVTNATGNATLEICHGSFVQNGGTLQVNRFVMTNACAQFVRTGGTLIYGSAVLGPASDDDSDGIPNGWEQAHGLDPLNAADANVDSDGDGFTNLQEYLAGTDPTNSASALRISGVVREGDNVRVTWMMGAGKTNAMQVASGGAGGGYTNAFADIFTITNTIGNITNYLDVGGATNFPSRYYRVRLVP